MIRALTSAADIAAAQSEFRAEFYDEATVLTRGIGFQGGGRTEDIAWHPSVGIWGYVDTLESVRSPEGTRTRDWNAFGLQNLEITTSLSVTVEANPPLQGANARVGGIFGRDGEGPLVLLHRGNIGGGTAGVGKELFWREFAGRTKFVYDGADLLDCAVVATLGEGTLVKGDRALRRGRVADEGGGEGTIATDRWRNPPRCRRNASGTVDCPQYR